MFGPHHAIRTLRKQAIAISVLGTIPAAPAGFLIVIDAYSYERKGGGAGTLTEFQIGGGNGYLVYEAPSGAAGAEAHGGRLCDVRSFLQNGVPDPSSLSVSLGTADVVDVSFAVTYHYEPMTGTV